MEKCKTCGENTILMTGTIYLHIDEEPYESGVKESSKEGITDVESSVSAHYCEKCYEITKLTI